MTSEGRGGAGASADLLRIGRRRCPVAVAIDRSALAMALKSRMAEWRRLSLWRWAALSRAGFVTSLARGG
jgi:hypothetical protein